MERQGTVCIGLDDQTEYALGKDEILSHLNSMCEMTRVGKIHWTLCRSEERRVGKECAA